MKYLWYSILTRSIKWVTGSYARLTDVIFLFTSLEPPDIELVWIKIMQNSPALILGNCYRPLSDFQFYRRFYDCLEKCGLGIGMCCPSVIWIRTVLVIATRVLHHMPVGNRGHPTTVFCKISVRRGKYFLEFSFAWERLKMSRLLLHSCTIFMHSLGVAGDLWCRIRDYLSGRT